MNISCLELPEHFQQWQACAGIRNERPQRYRNIAGMSGREGDGRHSYRWSGGANWVKI